MKVVNPDLGRSIDATRGKVSTRRANARGVVVTDGVTESHPTTDILFHGATVTEDDGTAIVTIGGVPGDSGGSASVPVQMLNNSGQDLLPGDVVVTDDTADTAITVTTSAGSVLIAGVVQEPIPDGSVGPVLFNGYAPVVNAAGSRGDYLQTSTTAALADTTASREAGSFGVLLTGNDLSDFVVASETTVTDTPVTSLSISLPTTPLDRVLFLALWLDGAASDVAIPNWTRIGAEAGYWYFYRISTGSDDADAAWTMPSVAVASVLLLHDTVSLGVPLEDHDYDSTTSAAAVSSLSDVPRYAIAGVDADVATPGSGFARISGGTASYSVGGGTPSLVQSKGLFTNGSGTATFDSTLTTGNLMLTIAFASGVHPWSTDPRYSVSCSVDPALTSLGYTDTNHFGSSGINSAGILAKNVGADTYSGPFGTASGCESGQTQLLLAEFENVGLIDYETLHQDGFDGSPVDFGGSTFTAGPDDLLIVALIKKRDGYGGSPDPAIDAAGGGFTELIDTYSITNGWCWAGYKVGDGDPSISYTSDGFGGWGAVAVIIHQAGSAAAGTLAGKYIAHASSATSPFTGGGAQDDAIFAVNLLRDAKPAALLYGPDLAGEGGFSGVAEDLTTAETDTTLRLAPDGAGGVEWAVTAGSLPWFLPEDYGAVGDDSTDDTTAMQAWLAALNGAGRGFAYLGGRYKVTAAVGSVTVPCTILGAGMAGNEIPGAAASYIHYAGTSGIVVLDIDSPGVKVEGLGFVQTGGSPSSGCTAIRAGNSTAADFFRLIGCSTSGFYIGFDVNNGTGITVDGNLAHGFAFLGYRLNYLDIPEGGDSQIVNNHADGATYAAQAGFRFESGGGPKILGNKTNSGGGGSLVNGIEVLIPAGQVTTMFNILGNSVEGWSSNGVLFTAGTGATVKNLTIVGNEVTTLDAAATAIGIVATTLGDISGVTIVGNTLDQASGTAPAIALTKIDTFTVGSNSIGNYTSELSTTGCTNPHDRTGGVAAGVEITGTPSSGDVPIASSGTAAAWGALSSSPTGSAGGDLSGTYPNPAVAKINGTTLATLSDAAQGDSLRWTGSTWDNATGFVVIQAPTPTVAVGPPFSVTITSVWGIDGSGNPYYDASNVTSGEEAALCWDPMLEEYALVSCVPA